MEFWGKGESVSSLGGLPELVAFYWNGASPAAHPVSDVTGEGFYMTTSDKWHVGTLLTLTLQKVSNGDTSRTAAHLVVLGRVVRHDEAGTFLDFVPVVGERRSTAVRPASKKEIAQFLRDSSAGG